MAFFTQFINPATNSFVQFGVLMLTSAAVAGIILFGYALVASRAQNAFNSRQARRNVSYVCGSFYLSGSALMAATR